MTISWFAGRTTLQRLHHTVQRNILRNHQARYESTKQTPSSSTSTSSSSTNASTTTTTTTTASIPPLSPPSPIPQRTIPGPAWAWIDPLLTPFRAYSRMQQRSPLMTQLEATLVIYYLGDLSAQTVQTNVFVDAQYEPIRGLRAMLIGSLSSIPGYKWFLFLGRNFNYSSHVLSLAVKVVVNQCVFTPVFNTYFFGMQTLLAGGSLQDAKERVVNTVPVSWKNSWKVWPAVTAFSFTFIPWQHRNLFAGVIAIGWQTYLSWLNRKEEHREAVVDAKTNRLDLQEKQASRKRAKKRVKGEEEHAT